MEHKAFIFDTSTFNQELREIIISSGRSDDAKSLKKFIKEHISKLYSPYTGEQLNEDWEEEFEKTALDSFSQNEALYEFNYEELVEAYTQLISIYKEANDRRLGLMMTF